MTNGTDSWTLNWGEGETKKKDTVGMVDAVSGGGTGLSPWRTVLLGHAAVFRG